MLSAIFAERGELWAQGACASLVDGAVGVEGLERQAEMLFVRGGVDHSLKFSYSVGFSVPSRHQHSY
jgi:hypothetical protein